MNLSDIKKEVRSASYKFFKDRDARLESVQIENLPFRLVRTADYYGSSIDNYLVKTPEDYSDFSYADVKRGEVRLISTFTLSQIKNSKKRDLYSDLASEMILQELNAKYTNLESFF